MSDDDCQRPGPADDFDRALGSWLEAPLSTSEEELAARLPALLPERRVRRWRTRAALLAAAAAVVAAVAGVVALRRQALPPPTADAARNIHRLDPGTLLVMSRDGSPIYVLLPLRELQPGGEP